MTAVALKTTSYSSGHTTGKGYVLSVLLHAAVIAAAFTSVPFFHRNLPVENPPLIVDLVTMADVTSAAPPPTPEPAPVTPVAPPEPPQPVQAEAPAADAMPPPPKEVAPIKEPTPQPAVKPIPKPPAPDTKKKDIAMLQDLLKSLDKKAPAPQPQAQSASNTPSNNIAPNITDRASMTELDAIRRHIEECWRIDPGTEGLENMSVDIQVSINPDGSVQDAKVLDMSRYFSDPQFRTLANSARNAVLGCGEKIPISAERYNILKEITMTFDPKGRIN